MSFSLNYKCEEDHLSSKSWTLERCKNTVCKQSCTPVAAIFVNCVFDENPMVMGVAYPPISAAADFEGPHNETQRGLAK